ncbi:MAG: hypothetical protein WCA19_24885 [Candidatus Acidiferrales bacterium]
MKPISVQTLTKLAACAVLAMGLSASAVASCGDSLAAMASAKAIVSPSISQQLATASTADGTNNSSIVGLWYVQFVVGEQTIQEAFQNWNLGGTEVHNPNVDPRSGNVCLGTWVRTPGGGFKLAHRVWNYDATGDFMGTIQLSETVHLSHQGTVHTGSFKLDFYDPSGNFVTEVAGNVTGQRIQVE